MKRSAKVGKSYAFACKLCRATFNALRRGRTCRITSPSRPGEPETGSINHNLGRPPECVKPTWNFPESLLNFPKVSSSPEAFPGRIHRIPEFLPGKWTFFDFSEKNAIYQILWSSINYNDNNFLRDKIGTFPWSIESFVQVRKLLRG